MSNFLFGVAFDRLLFNALNKYLLKNSSSIETEMRSLILPLEVTMTSASHEYLSLYLGTDNSYVFQQTPEARGNLRYSVDSMLPDSNASTRVGFVP
jgi:hypothetical protein